MTRPHQRFGFKEPIAKQLPRGTMAWSLLVMTAWIALAVIYVMQVTHAAPRGDELRQLEKRAENVERDVTALEDQVARGSSMHNLSQQAQTLGLVPVDEATFANPSANTFVRR